MTGELARWRHQVTQAAGRRRAGRAVAVAVFDAAMRHRGPAHPGVAKLARATGYCRRQVKYALAWLRDNGWLDVVSHLGGGRGRATVYRPAWPGGPPVGVPARKGAMSAPRVVSTYVATDTHAGTDRRGDVVTDPRGTFLPGTGWVRWPE